MNIRFSARPWAEYLEWQSESDRDLKRLNALIEECTRSPFRGRGKPEPLRQNLKGWWSRRITKEHRLVYRVTGSGDQQCLDIAQCRFHY
ncbi:MAG: Txe/YoeB family addiction module toxin [Pacificimonas sp.]|jgi:toxin YoeB|nr:Txe/YoeB family addiction module toxin [Pacificimonas sp.]